MAPTSCCRHLCADCVPLPVSLRTCRGAQTAEALLGLAAVGADAVPDPALRLAALRGELLALAEEASSVASSAALAAAPPVRVVSGRAGADRCGLQRFLGRAG